MSKYYEPHMRPWAICHGESCSYDLFDEYYKPRRLKFEERYKEALDPIMSRLRRVYNEVFDSDEEIRTFVLREGLYQLLVMSTAVRDCTLKLCDDDETNYSGHLQKNLILGYFYQIPLQVLEAIVSIAKPELQRKTVDVYNFVIDLILRFYSMPSFKEERPGCLHILDVYRKSLLKHVEPYDRQQTSDENPPIIPSATKLQEARIGITACRTSSLMGISFKKKTLHLPLLSIDNNTTELFKELIIFERNEPCAGLHFTSYVYFLSNLLNDVADSNLLKNRGIIETVLTDYEVVKIFELLLKYIAENPWPLQMSPDLMNLRQQVKEKYNKNLKGWRKDLFETYLKSPWAIISLFGGVLLLSLTIIQTVYTVFGYYKS